jgi:hypothetical protein
MKWYQNLNYTRWAIINFIVLSIFGVLLRYMQLYNLSWLNYQFILHAHSHFAFSGWMFFSIALLIASLCNGYKLSSGFKTVLLLTLISSYGMLASFTWQGYKAVSISFSTLFVLLTFRFTYLVFKGGLLKHRVNTIAYQLISGSLILLCLSALGPLALGPLAALGLKNTPYYQDAVYYYLHFQMNGFMLLAALGLLASSIQVTPLTVNSGRWLSLFVCSTIPLFFIFTLWGKPGYWLMAFSWIGAGLNLVSWLVLCVTFWRNLGQLLFIEKVALLALTLKCFFQILVCIPAIGDWTFLSRNLIIGYIHLLTLGIVMPLLIGQFVRKRLLSPGKRLTVLNYAYINLVVIYLVLLFVQPLLARFEIIIPAYQNLLFWLCVLFLLFAIGLMAKVKKNNTRI